MSDDAAATTLLIELRPIEGGPASRSPEERGKALADAEREAQDELAAREADLQKALANAEPLAKDEPFKDREEAGRASDVVRDLRHAIKACDEARLALTEPYRDTTKSINGPFNELMAKPKAAEEAIKRKGHAWNKARQAEAQEKARQEAERQQKAQEDAIADKRAAEELAAEEPENPEAVELADEAGRAAAAAAAAPAPVARTEEHRRVRGNLGAIGSRTVYKWEVADQAVVVAEAPELLTIDAAAVKGRIDSEKAAAKEQGRPFDLSLIPGVRIWADEIPVGQ